MAGPGMEVGAIYATIEARGFAKFAEDVQRIGQGIDRAKGQIQGFITETYRVQKVSGASIASAFAKQFTGATAAATGGGGGAAPSAAADPAKSFAGVTPAMKKIIDEMAKARKPFTVLQRALNQIGGEMTQGIQKTSEVMRRTIAKQIEPQMKSLQKLMVENVAAARGMGPVGTKAFGWAVSATTALGKFNFQLDILQKGIAPITGLAGKAFFGLTGGILGFVTAGLAGTVQGAALSYQFQQLSRQIADVFLPVIDQVFEKLQNLVEWFRNLSDDQLEQIEHWALIAAEVAGAVFVFSKVIKVIGSMSEALQGLIALGFELNLVTGGILLLIGGLVTGFGVWAAKTDDGHNALRRLWDAFQPILDALMRLGEAILPLVNTLFDALAEVLSSFNVGDFFVGVIDALTNVIRLLSEAIEDAKILANWVNESWLGQAANFLGNIADDALGLIGIGGGKGSAGEAGDNGVGGFGAGGDFGSKKGHRELTQQGTGFESLVSSFSRIQTAALKTDYQKKSADHLEELVGIVGDIKEGVNNGSGGDFGGGVELGN